MITEQIPVLKIGPLLMVTIQTELHDRLAEEIQDSVLQRIRETDAEGVVIDITAVEVVDSFISRVLTETAEMARVMSAEVVLVGMRPAVAMTLLEMGMQLPNVETALDFEAALQSLGYRLETIGPGNGRGRSEGIE